MRLRRSTFSWARVGAAPGAAGGSPQVGERGRQRPSHLTDSPPVPSTNTIAVVEIPNTDGTVCFSPVLRVTRPADDNTGTSVISFPNSAHRCGSRAGARFGHRSHDRRRPIPGLRCGHRPPRRESFQPLTSEGGQHSVSTSSIDKASTVEKTIDVDTLRLWLADDAELAVLDIRPSDEVGYASPLFATNIPARPPRGRDRPVRAPRGRTDRPRRRR